MTGVPAERAARQGCAVLAVFSGGEFSGWKLVPWDR